MSVGCAHHWKIQSPNGETSRATCRLCPAVRYFFNYERRGRDWRGKKQVCDTCLTPKAASGKAFPVDDDGNLETTCITCLEKGALRLEGATA